MGHWVQIKITQNTKAGFSVIDLNGLNYSEIKNLLIQEKWEMEWLTRENIAFIAMAYLKENKIGLGKTSEAAKLGSYVHVVFDLTKILCRTNNWKKTHGRPMRRKTCK